MITRGQLLSASKKCKRGVSWKSSTQMYYMKRLAWISDTLTKIENTTYKPKRQKIFKIHERGKVRLIKANHISDRVVQKAYNENILKPALYPHLIYDNAASQEGKGTEFCLQRLKHHLRTYYIHHGNYGYILLIDFSNYFGNIDKNILLDRIEPRIKDADDFELLKVLMRGDTEGLGLGSEINQTGAIFYTSGLDHFIKEKLHIKHYLRYMDDLILIHESRDYLEFCFSEIMKVCDSLNIVVNIRKCKIINLKSDWFVYLKKKVRLTDSGHIIMKPVNKNIQARRKKIKHQYDLFLQGLMPIDSIIQSYISWRGYALNYDISYDQLIGMDYLFRRLFGRSATHIVLSKFKGGEKHEREVTRRFHEGIQDI